MPGSMLAGALWIGLSGDRLEELVLLAALPTLFTGVVLAGRYRVYVEPASSTMIVTSIGFAVAAPPGSRPRMAALYAGDSARPDVGPAACTRDCRQAAWAKLTRLRPVCLEV